MIRPKRVASICLLLMVLSTICYVFAPTRFQKIVDAHRGVGYIDGNFLHEAGLAGIHDAGFLPNRFLPFVGFTIVSSEFNVDEIRILVAEESRLDSVRLVSDSLTHKGIAELAKLEHLEHLFLAMPHVDKETIDAIASIPRLKTLHLSCKTLEIQHLKSLQFLSHLNLGCDEISDGQLLFLASTAISNFKIESPHITNASLQTFAQMKNLKILTLIDTQISAEAINHFTDHHPKVFVADKARYSLKYEGIYDVPIYEF